jgi:uncharacterized protein
VIAYFDSSSLVKLFLVENGSDDVELMWTSGLVRATSRVTHAEVACALAAAVRRGTLESHPPGVLDGSFFRRNAEFVEPDDIVITGAAILGARHGLKGLDAIHVSSALSLRELDPLVVSWDERQRAAVIAEGLSVYPETTTAALR